jgi:hypothetical protein
MYEPPPGSAPGYQLAHQLIAMGRMKIINASCETLKFGSRSSIGWPRPSIGCITGWPLGSGGATCNVESLDINSLSPTHASAWPPRRRPTSTSENQAAAMTAVIFTKNCSMSITSTPHSPECAAKTTFKTPQMMIVCQAGNPNRMFAILQAANVTVPMMKQLKKRPR